MIKRIRTIGTMKLPALLLIFSLCTIRSQANRIDSLQTDADVVTFLRSVNENFNSPKYEKFELRSTETLRKDQPCSGIADKWKVKNWEKADFNNDGRTDLLVTLFWYNYGVYVVMDKADGQFTFLTLSFNVHDPCKLAKAVRIDGRQLLLYYGEWDAIKKLVVDSEVFLRTDTLIYLSGDFVEYNPMPVKKTIDSVQFHTGYCLGSCPVFQIKFDKAGNAEYEAGTYNPKSGTFRTTLKQENLKEILDLLDYLKLDSLNKYYSIPLTDDQTVALRIRYSDGKVQMITDYGLRGTFGLRHLYNKFFALRINQDWK